MRTKGEPTAHVKRRKVTVETLKHGTKDLLRRTWLGRNQKTRLLHFFFLLLAQLLALKNV